MTVEEIISECKKEKLYVFFDMDGVLAEYRDDIDGVLSNKPKFYLNSRPIQTMIECTNKLIDAGVEVCIMSNCYYREQYADKITWLKKWTKIKIENVYINVLSELDYDDGSKPLLKYQRIKQAVGENQRFILIEDDLQIIKATNKKRPNSAYHISNLLN